MLLRITMKKWLTKIGDNRYFLLFILLFAYVQSIYLRFLVRQDINAYTFTPEAALSSLCEAGVLFVIILFFIKRMQITGVFRTKVMIKVFGSSLFTYLIVMKIISLVIAILFDNIERNFNGQTFIYTAFSDFLDGFIYGSFFLTYYYYQKNIQHQKQLSIYNQALAESKIHQLKAQLNPHFLFNNLNVLDQLIEEDKHKASDFLNEFAEIYRYVLQASDKKLINIIEELDFAAQYFNLIRYKYGQAYQMRIDNKNVNGYIVPLTLQLLIENAIHHNLGSVEKPICITITVAENISIANNIILKPNRKPSSGRALNNLREQYKLLTEKPILIEQTKTTFLVSIPSINTHEI